jgi:hypothetical protein
MTTSLRSTVHDQVRTDRNRRPSALVAMTAQPVFDLAKPAIELFRAAAIHGRECADHAVAAGGYYKVNAGDEEHRRRDQRQAEAVAKSREWIGGTQNPISCSTPRYTVPRLGFIVLAFSNIGTTEGPRQSK